MLDKVMVFFAAEINTYLRSRTGDLSDIVVLSPIVNEEGKYASDSDTVALNLINIEEEATFKEQLPEQVFKDGQHLVLEPKLKLNLFVMFAANFKLYDQALKYLSHIILYFQAHRVFTPDQYPALTDSRGDYIERLVVELQRPDYDQLNQIWAYIGGKQLPSVIYKIKLVSLQDQAPSTIKPPIQSITTNIREM
jgi:hypothetical protein